MTAGPALAAILAVSVLATSFLSGIFGMAGGLILLGILLAILDVAPAMVLFGVTQFASNGWRTALWRNYVDWRIVGAYVVGALVAFAVMKVIAFFPDKATVYLGLGLMPFLADRLPPVLRLDITRRGAPVLCGMVLMVLQIVAGAAGNVLDVFFQNSTLDRRAIVATKAATQAVGHFLRVIYFGSYAALHHESLSPWIYALAVVCAFGGTSLAALVLQRLSETAFRRWSRLLIRTVSAFYVVNGLWLLLR